MYNGKQMIYFDIHRLNEYISNATWTCKNDVEIGCDTFSNNYIFIQQQLPWNESQTYCKQTYGSDLASIHTDTQNEEAMKLCDIGMKNGCMIGLIGISDEWIWIDASASISAYDNLSFNDNAANNVLHTFRKRILE